MITIFEKVDLIFQRFRLVNLILGIFFIIVASIFYFLLLDVIPTHFTILGIPLLHTYTTDGYGSSWFIFSLPIIGIIIGLILNTNFIYEKYGKLNGITTFIELLLIGILLFFWIVCSGYFLILVQYIL
ncbi:hypothetical protein P0E82_12265 [Enterococcus faecalis]|uniref:hypothetical protein n=1 Tax=Enterococcus faecalis TaxID=1351 RepID=UPI0025B02287|nr:hypothetical protein [Enterococcus faecalis]MDN3123125.1 hypothetical protein [Enterococcus faecalis]